MTLRTSLQQREPHLSLELAGRLFSLSPGAAPHLSLALLATQAPFPNDRPLVQAHPKGNGCDNHANFVGHEVGLHLGSATRLHPRMVAAGRDTSMSQPRSPNSSRTSHRESSAPTSLAPPPPPNRLQARPTYHSACIPLVRRRAANVSVSPCRAQYTMAGPSE